MTAAYETFVVSSWVRMPSLVSVSRADTRPCWVGFRSSESQTECAFSIISLVAIRNSELGVELKLRRCCRPWSEFAG